MNLEAGCACRAVRHKLTAPPGVPGVTRGKAASLPLPQGACAVAAFCEIPAMWPQASLDRRRRSTAASG
jgi:hypothetical protein